MKTKIIKIITILFLVIFFSNQIFAQQNELLRYEFEEGSGSIILDTGASGYNYHGIKNKGSWDSAIYKYGTYSFKFDGNDDFITSISSEMLPNEFSTSFWIYRKAGLNEQTFFVIEDSTDHLHISYNAIDDNVEFDYLLQNGTETKIILDTIPIVVDTWVHIILSLTFDYQETGMSQLMYWRNGEITKDINLTEQIFSSTIDKFLRIGADFDKNNELKGNIDEFRIFDFVPKTHQVVELYNSNYLELETTDDDYVIADIAGTQEFDIILSSTPLSDDMVEPFTEFTITLNSLSSCELYIDNLIDTTITNFITTTYEKQLEVGEHSYMLYCYYDYNTTRYFEISDTTSFNVEKPVRNVEFYIYDENGNLLSNFDDLYLSTPCLEKKEFNEYYIPDREIYLQNLNDGHASFNLSYDDDYEFCLLKGKINTRDDFYSLKYDLVDVEKNTELGVLSVTGETYTYSLNTDTGDLYGIANPTFWGKTWEGLFELFAGLLVGSIIIFIGLAAKSDKLMMVGGLIIAIGFGFSVTSFIGGVLI